MVTSTASGRAPAPRAPLIGRERELATLRDLMLHADERVLTLTGFGGVGKTRLALQLAADVAPAFPQRVWLVELAALADPALVPLTVAAALGIRDTATTTVLEAVSTVLDSQPALLILDNCEHLIDACAALADHLLIACPSLRILATSREPLQIAGERQYRVAPLALPAPNRPPSVDTLAVSPAVQLFVARAQAAAPGVHLTPENVAAVAGICARLDGIPLALELAAAHARVLSFEQILVRLDGSFRVLVGGSRVAPTRQRTLRATLEWSDALLTAGERTLFRRLAVFAGEFLLDIVEVVCADDALPSTDILEVLTRLVDKSLVVVAHGEARAWYRLLEPVRQYAGQGLTASGEWEAVRERHATSYLLLAEQAAPGLYGRVQDAWLERLEREQGNLRAALRWAEETGDGVLALRLATALVPFWAVHGHLAEGRRWLQMALAAPVDAVAPALRMRALAGAGRLTHLHAAYAEAARLHTESLALARDLNDQHGIAVALTELGMSTRQMRDLTRSIECIEEGLARFHDLGDEAGIAVALLNLGASVGNHDDMPRAVSVLTDAHARFEALGDTHHAAIASALLAAAAIETGDPESSSRYVTASLAGHAQLGNRWFVTFSLMTLVQILMARKQWSEAARMLGAAQAIGEAVSTEISPRSYDELGARIRTHLDTERFTAAWQGGHALAFEQAVDAALALAAPAAPKPSPARSTLPGAATLTRREREVAELLARGYTDQQIADALFITPGTVGVHVHHILGKLGLYSRVQVAASLGDPAPSARDIH